MTTNKKIDTALRYNKAQKLNKNFMYQDLKRSNCYNSDFSNSNFNFTSLRGAQFKSCNFYGCTFKSAELVATNLKKTKFAKAKFENAVFEACNLEGADFSGATFKNTIFLNTDISKALNLNIKESEVKIFDEMPTVEMSERLENSINLAMKNQYVKKSRTLDTKDGGINNISVIILLENFKEKQLIEGFTLLSERMDKEFCTLSYIIKTLQGYKAQGLL
ncbi:pentapeptide repeat-containing protein [Romboutsia weinsteinii]|uniref:Pentapeptide repeat-containing protein n=1 Tax=Romboutsia weinsteinii TaxID=2020949 RepID=A0A371J5P7_9FIRM|nr:pentapeptide repeat-containing protein [Romboutsia weinsteinii]RDY28034.1 pentapeptide repeat-containing protein [Romboutsia weinsteinii]